MSEDARDVGIGCARCDFFYVHIKRHMIPLPSNFAEPERNSRMNKYDHPRLTP